jgi:ADP-L-glycero-D-manno-heptose 6-epimerase
MVTVVTGACGFIGSRLAKRLAATGTSLILVDHETTRAKAANLAGVQQFHFIRHDHFLQELEAGKHSPEAIYHLGACSSTTETNWTYLNENNIEYTRRLWNWASRNACPFVYASSAATYGDGAQGFDDATPPTQLTPLNLYGKSKNDFDIWALAQVAAKHPSPPAWAGMKFFNVYGPGEEHKGRMASVVWQAAKQIEATGKMKLFRSTVPGLPDGGQSRDFVYVEDCVSHMLFLSAKPGTAGVFNSGTGKARSFHDLVLATYVALGKTPEIEFIDMPADLAKQYQNFTEAKMNKLYAHGYPHPPTSLEEGVRKYVETMRG